LLRDEDTIERARDDARALIEADPLLDAHPAVAAEAKKLVDAERAEYLDKS
jgi:ATP-dependent DNA helicase RecG